MKKFITIYHVFTAANNDIWKIVPMLIPEENLDTWVKEDTSFFTKEQLPTLNVSIDE